MEKFKPGDIFFINHHDNPLSKVIAWFMKSSFSHSGLILEQTSKRTYTLETSDYEVTQSLFEDYIDDPYVSIEVYRKEDLSDEEREDIMERALAVDNAGYGYLQLLSFAVKRLLKRVNISIPNIIRQGLVCCHVVLYGYQGSGIKELDKVDPENWDTQELYDFVKGANLTLVYKKDGDSNI